MATVTLKGNPIRLEGNMPEAGAKAPDFKIVRDDMSEASLKDFSGKVKVLVAVPSLDTPVCATETKKFNEKLAGDSDVAKGERLVGKGLAKVPYLRFRQLLRRRAFTVFYDARADCTQQVELIGGSEVWVSAENPFGQSGS